MATPAEVIRELANYAVDHETFCAEELSVREKSGQKIPFKLWPSQRKMLDAYRKAKRRNRPVRLVGQKARQVGWSEMGAYLMWRHCAFWPGQMGLMVGHEHKSARNIYNYLAEFDASYQAKRGIRKLESTGRRRPTQQTPGAIEWAGGRDRGGSTVETATARNLEVGRSAALRHMHLSEFAFWPDADTFMTGVMQSIAQDPDTFLLVESTSNGEGGPFHKLCIDAQNAFDADNDWQFIFFGAHEHPEYRLAYEPHFPSELENEEINMLRTIEGMTLEFLRWRRWAMKAKLLTPDLFRQEYPCTSGEAWLSSGWKVFPRDPLNRQILIPAAEWTAGSLEHRDYGAERRLVFNQDPYGRSPLRILRKPRAGLRYGIGADVAEGKDVYKGKGSTTDPDYSTAHVVEQESGEVVAVMKCRLEPKVFASHLAALGKFYNTAYIVPERNNHGIAVIYGLMEVGYPIDRIYRDHRKPHEYYRPESIQDLGWRTDQQTKPLMISELNGALMTGQIGVRCEMTMAELRAYQHNADGTMSAPVGEHDDLVVSLALARQAVIHMPAQRIDLGDYAPRPYQSGRDTTSWADAD